MNDRRPSPPEPRPDPAEPGGNREDETRGTPAGVGAAALIVVAAALLATFLCYGRG